MPPGERRSGRPEFTPRIPEEGEIKRIAITDDLVHNMELGVLQVGGKLPSMGTLAKAYHVDISTMRAVYMTLTQQGRIQPRQGIGTIVTVPEENRVGSSKLSKKQRLADEILHEVLSGHLHLGQQLPTEQQLIQRYGVARNTVRGAIDTLVGQGIVERRHPEGTFITSNKFFLDKETTTRLQRHQPLATDPHVQTRSLHGLLQVEFSPLDTDYSRWEQIVSRRGGKPDKKVWEEEITPSGEIAELLQSESLVVVQNRLGMVNGIPYHRAQSFYPRDVVEELNLKELSWDLTDYEKRVRKQTTALMPDRAAVELFRCPPGVPLLRHRITSYDKSLRPLSVREHLAPTDREHEVFVYRGKQSH